MNNNIKFNTAFLIGKSRIIIVSILTILICSIILSYLRNNLQMDYIAQTEYANTAISLSPSGLMPDLDKSDQCKSPSKFYVTANLLSRQNVNHANTQSQTGAILEELYPEYFDYRFTIVHSKAHKGVFEAYEDGNLIGYWGPKGFSQTSPAKLGSFSNAIIDTNTRISATRMFCYDLYDKQTKTLHTLQMKPIKNQSKITYQVKTIPGIKLPQDSSFLGFANGIISGREAISNEVFDNSWLDIRQGFSPAMRPAAEEELIDNNYENYDHFSNKDNDIFVDMTGKNFRYNCYNFYHGLRFYDRNGQIYEIDDETQAINPLFNIPVAGIDSLEDNYYCCYFNSIQKETYNQIKDHKDSKQIASETIGYYFAAFSKDDTLTVALYDKTGKMESIHTDKNQRNFLHNQSSTLYLTRSAVENIPGPAIIAASYIFRDIYQPRQQWQTIFLMPLSVANYTASLKGNNPLVYLSNSSFSIFIAICLLVLYTFNSRKYGLTKFESRYWLYLIALFGIMGYIAYFIARPKITKVTCSNCGKLRRPDQDRCHFCRADWDIPQLEKVNWQIK